MFISIDEDDAGVIFDDVQRELIVALLDGTKDVAATLAIVTAAIGNPEDVAKTTQCFRNIIKMAFLKGTFVRQFVKLHIVCPISNVSKFYRFLKGKLKFVLYFL